MEKGNKIGYALAIYVLILFAAIKRSRDEPLSAFEGNI